MRDVLDDLLRNDPLHIQLFSMVLETRQLLEESSQPRQHNAMAVDVSHT